MPSLRVRRTTLHGPAQKSRLILRYNASRRTKSCHISSLKICAQPWQRSTCCHAAMLRPVQRRSIPLPSAPHISQARGHTRKPSPPLEAALAVPTRVRPAEIATAVPSGRRCEGDSSCTVPLRAALRCGSPAPLGPRWPRKVPPKLLCPRIRNSFPSRLASKL